MKKIMFNDKYRLTEAVLSGKKTVTRRIMKVQPRKDYLELLLTKDGKYVWGQMENGNQLHSSMPFDAPYKIGEIVAVAQCYDDIVKEIPHYQVNLVGYDITGLEPACKNKMFVCANLMPHQIQITRSIIAERLQDITDEDCLKEYPECDKIIQRHINKAVNYGGGLEDNTMTHREVFAWLIDKIYGKGTWQSNPYVWRIEFKLIK